MKSKKTAYMTLKDRCIRGYYNRFKYGENTLFDKLYIDFAKEYNLKGHSKYDKLFRLAWEFGLNEGEYVVLIYFDNMLPLIK